MGQQLWATCKNPKYSPGWMSTCKAQLSPPLQQPPCPRYGCEERQKLHLASPIPPSTFPTLQLHAAVRDEGLGWLFSMSPGHLLEPVLPSQKSSDRKNKTEKFCVCILAGVSGTKKVQGTLVWHVLQVQPLTMD